MNTRTRPVFEAVADTTVAGPAMIRLACGCATDADGSVWAPCPSIYGTYGCAAYLTSTGRRSDMLARCEARIQAHVAAQRVVVSAEQGGLL